MNVKVYNREVPIFEMEIDDRGRVMSVGKILKKELMPLPLMNDFSPESVRKWLDGRKIPEDRLGLMEARRAFGKIVDYHRCMFSLSDQYWIQYKETEKWEKKNFFTNAYNQDFGRIFFRPWTVNPDDLKQETPDHTTNGVLKKRWVQDRKTKESSLIKMGDRSAHQDALSEVLSSMTLERLGLIPFVRYELIIDGLQYCSKCVNFIDEKSEFVPASQLFHMEKRDREKDDRRAHFLRMIKKYAPQIKDAEGYLDRMMFCDYCTLNNDRHLGNFGFIRSAVNGKIQRFAPIFDSGSSFFGNGNKNGEQSRIFSDEQIRNAVSSVLKSQYGKISKNLKEKDLVELVENYPVFSEQEKKEVVNAITSVYNDLRAKIRVIQENGGERRNQDGTGADRTAEENL